MQLNDVTKHMIKYLLFIFNLLFLVRKLLKDLLQIFRSKKVSVKMRKTNKVSTHLRKLGENSNFY